MRPLALALGTLAVAVAATGGPAVARPAVTTCSLGNQGRTLGPTYVTSLTVSSATCSTGIKVVKAYYKCRIKHGKAGRCVTKVLGYACTEQRTSIPIEFKATVTCSKGAAKIVHRYQQDT